MALNKTQRLCATISAISNLTISPNTCLFRPHTLNASSLSKPIRSKAFPHKSKLVSRSFFTDLARSADSSKPLKQESEISRRRSKTLQQEIDVAPEAFERQVIITTIPDKASTSSTTSSLDFSAPSADPAVQNTANPPPSELSSNLKPTPASEANSLQYSRKIVGRVTRTGTMSKTVAVSTNRQHFDLFLQKHYTKPVRTLVHDPDQTLVEGDVIEYGLFPPAERDERIKKGKGKRVKYVVKSVVTPFGIPLDQRASIRTWEA